MTDSFTLNVNLPSSKLLLSHRQLAVGKRKRKKKKRPTQLPRQVGSHIDRMGCSLRQDFYDLIAGVLEKIRFKSPHSERLRVSQKNTHCPTRGKFFFFFLKKEGSSGGFPGHLVRRKKIVSLSCKEDIFLKSANERGCGYLWRRLIWDGKSNSSGKECRLAT